MNEKRLEELFARYYQQTATAAETAELMALIREAEPALLSALILRHGEALEVLSPVTSPEEAGHLLNAILGQAPPKRRSIWPVFAAAAVVLGILAAAAFWLLQGGRPAAPRVAQHTAAAEITPAREKAVLLLDDSSAIGLDTLASGSVRRQGSATLTHSNGQLVYAATAQNGGPVYNTIATGKGNFYKLVLADGTKVWLNAASSLRFPVTFSGSERLVEIRGEVYFEVAKDAARPFRVKMPGEGMVEVLGTHFNINAYPENGAVRATLLHGAVKVIRGGQSKQLAPGQQAVLSGAAGISLENSANLGRVMAWKEGYFWFEDTKIRDIMSEVARWYDVEVRYEGRITEDGFSGRFTRDAPLSRLLQILKLNDMDVHVESKTITIKQ